MNNAGGIVQMNQSIETNKSQPLISAAAADPQSHQKREQLQFEVAALLGCSPSFTDLQEAHIILKSLLQIKYRRSECLYQLALVCLKLGDYKASKLYADELVELDEVWFLAILFLSEGTAKYFSFIIEKSNYGPTGLRICGAVKSLHTSDGLTGTLTIIGMIGGLLYVTYRWSSMRQFLSKSFSFH